MWDEDRKIVVVTTDNLPVWNDYVQGRIQEFILGWVGICDWNSDWICARNFCFSNIYSAVKLKKKKPDWAIAPVQRMHSSAPNFTFEIKVLLVMLETQQLLQLRTLLSIESTTCNWRCHFTFENKVSLVMLKTQQFFTIVNNNFN